MSLNSVIQKEYKNYAEVVTQRKPKILKAAFNFVAALVFIILTKNGGFEMIQIFLEFPEWPPPQFPSYTIYTLNTVV